MHVRDARGAAAEGIDDDQPRAPLARLEQQPPEVRRGRERIPAPDDDRARVHPLLGVDLGRRALRRHRPRHARARADRAHERRAAERVEQAVAHDVALQEPLRAEVAVGGDGCAAVALARREQARGGHRERLVPARLAEPALALRARAQERAQQPLRRVHALEVVRHLAAQEARRDRMLGVACDRGRAPIGVDLDEQGAGVGAIVRAGAADDSAGCAHGAADATPAASIPPEPPPYRLESHRSSVLRSRARGHFHDAIARGNQATRAVGARPRGHRARSGDRAGGVPALRPQCGRSARRRRARRARGRRRTPRSPRRSSRRSTSTAPSSGSRSSRWMRRSRTPRRGRRAHGAVRLRRARRPGAPGGAHGLSARARLRLLDRGRVGREHRGGAGDRCRGDGGLDRVGAASREPRAGGLPGDRRRRRRRCRGPALLGAGLRERRRRGGRDAPGRTRPAPGGALRRLRLWRLRCPPPAVIVVPPRRRRLAACGASRAAAGHRRRGGPGAGRARPALAGQSAARPATEAHGRGCARRGRTPVPPTACGCPSAASPALRRGLSVGCRARLAGPRAGRGRDRRARRDVHLADPARAGAAAPGRAREGQRPPGVSVARSAADRRRLRVRVPPANVARMRSRPGVQGRPVALRSCARRRSPTRESMPAVSARRPARRPCAARP